MEGSTKTARQEDLEQYKERVRKWGTKYEGFGENLTLSEWARIFGLQRATIWRYLQRGLTIEEIADLRGVK